MLVKASIFATILVCAMVSLSRVDFRELYNEMYPVNGLRRDVLTLCHQAEPTFVRAVEQSRIDCYDSMPDPVELAIGWVRTSSRLAAMRRPTPIEMAERMLLAATVQGRIDRLGENSFTGYAMGPAAALRPCGEAANATALATASLSDLAPALDDGRLARSIASGEIRALAALGAPPSGVAAATQPLGGGDAAVQKTARFPSLPLINAAAAADLGSERAALPRERSE